MLVQLIGFGSNQQINVLGAFELRWQRCFAGFSAKPPQFTILYCSLSQCFPLPSHSSAVSSLFLNSKTKVSLFLLLLSPLVLALPQLHHLIPDGEVTSIKITRQDPSDPLAISIVGGNETPLVRILIQDIYREGVIARDGRLLPGDMILKVAKRVSLNKKQSK